MKKILALFLLINSSAFGQELRRGASFGAAIMDVKDSLRSVLKLSSTQGTLIKNVFPATAAQKAGLVANDLLIEMDGEKIKNTAHFLQLLKTHSGGDKIKVSYYREAKLMVANITLLSKPTETSKDYDIIYSSVVSGKNHLRTIITKPKIGNNFPAVFIIGGVGCYSIDNPMVPEISSIKLWSDSLTRNGFVTIRVEKTGMGDSKGTPCTDCDFSMEKQGYLDGLKQLKSLAYVDKKNIFIAGFSIGGVVAPLLAQQETIKGIIVYGTAGKNWLEYEIDNSLRQQILDGNSPEAIDKFMRDEYIRLYGLFVEKKSPEQLLKEHPMEGHLFQYPMRVEYFQQVADVNIREAWAKTKAKVLALHGSSDFVSSADEHQDIAELVNKYNPGNAMYVEIANADHWSFLAKSELESAMRTTTELNPLPLSTSIKWLKDNLPN